MSDIYTQNDLMGARPVFCVQFEYAGKIHRYSTEYVTLTADDGDTYEYLPTIRDFDYTESAQILSQDIESNIVMMGLVLQDVNVLQLWSEGQTLEGTAAQFFYVLTKNEQVQQTYSQRVILYRGNIQEPQIGDPDDLDDFVSFSIESPPYESDNLLLDSNMYIDNRFSTRHLETADGKPYPVILGSGGYKVRQTEGTEKNLFSSPAYCIKEYDSHNARFMIAGHRVESTTASIQDDKYDTVTKTIQTANDGRGNIYSYIEIVPSDNVAMPNYSGSGDSREWWVYINNGGLLNQYGDGDLSRGGDICRWALSRSGTVYDDAEWANLSVITALDIGDDKPCIQISPITTQRNTADLVNQLTLRYAKKGHDQSQSNICRITNVKRESYDVVSDYAIKSINLYGIKPVTIEVDYIYDRDTAVKVAMDRVRSGCLPVYTVQIATAAEFGYLRIGDIVDVNIERYFVLNRRMIIAGKVWNDTQWSFTLLFE